MQWLAPLPAFEPLGTLVRQMLNGGCPWTSHAVHKVMSGILASAPRVRKSGSAHMNSMESLASHALLTMA